MITASRDPAGRYFVSMAYEVGIAALPTRRNVVGVDVGVKDVVVTSEGFKPGAAKYTYCYARQLRRVLVRGAGAITDAVSNSTVSPKFMCELPIAEDFLH